MQLEEMTGKTQNIISKGREWIINEVKISELRGRGERVFQLDLNGPFTKKSDLGLIT